MSCGMLRMMPLRPFFYKGAARSGPFYRFGRLPPGVDSAACLIREGGAGAEAGHARRNSGAGHRKGGRRRGRRVLQGLPGYGAVRYARAGGWGAALSVSSVISAATPRRMGTYPHMPVPGLTYSGMEPAV